MAASGPKVTAYSYAGLGFEFLGALGMFGLLGFFGDRWLGWQPWLLIVGVFIGFGAGLWHVIRRASAIQRVLEEQEREEAGAAPLVSDRQRLDQLDARLQQTERQLQSGIEEMQRKLRKTQERGDKSGAED
ncbi:MAG: AtpZ/AtpI family protein [Leptospirales bacterium]|nr:AtpZ/AtpI family protein [Leptospirales bacterium]